MDPLKFARLQDNLQLLREVEAVVNERATVTCDQLSAVCSKNKSFVRREGFPDRMLSGGMAGFW